MVRVPLYTLPRGGGLSSFLSHSFIGNARAQLLDALVRLQMVAPPELQQALARSAQTQQRSAQDLAQDLASAQNLGGP